MDIQTINGFAKYVQGFVSDMVRVIDYSVSKVESKYSIDLSDFPLGADIKVDLSKMVLHHFDIDTLPEHHLVFDDFISQVIALPAEAHQMAYKVIIDKQTHQRVMSTDKLLEFLHYIIFFVKELVNITLLGDSKTDSILTMVLRQQSNGLISKEQDRQELHAFVKEVSTECEKQFLVKRLS